MSALNGGSIRESSGLDIGHGHPGHVNWKSNKVSGDAHPQLLLLYNEWYKENVLIKRPFKLVHPSVHLSVSPSHFWGFRAFANKRLIGLSSNFVDELVGKLIMGLSSPDYVLDTFCWISVVSWPLTGRVVSAYFQTNRWSDWTQIWWMNSLWYSQARLTLVTLS